MATTKAKIIKLSNGSTTYIPITSTNAIQHYKGTPGDKSYVLLETYLGGLKSDITTNSNNIQTLANAVINAYTKIEDYEKSYVKSVDGHKNQISVWLPTTKTEGSHIITIDEVEHATNAVNATNLVNNPTITKTDALNSNSDSFTVTAGGKTSDAVSLTKAAATTYGVVKLNDVALSGHTHTSELSVNTSDATISYNTGSAGSKTTKAYKGGKNTYGFVAVDDAVSNDSVNPVQNKVIKKYADDKFVTKDAFNTFSASGMHYKGDTATIPTNPSSGDVYHVITNNITTGLGNGVTAEVGDFITYYKPSNGDGTWSVWDKNVDGAIYSGSNTLTSGQMLVVENASGKVKSQAIPTVSVSSTGTGNFVKSITNNDHAITYTMGYAVDTLAQSVTDGISSGVITNVTKSNGTLTVTYTNLATSDPHSGVATNAVSVTYIATVSQSTKGKITATKGTVKIKTMTGASTTAAGDVGLVPAPEKMTSGETVKVLGADGNWKTIKATIANTNQLLTNNIKYAESNKTVDIDESLFGTFGTVGDVVTISTTTPSVTVDVS